MMYKQCKLQPGPGMASTLLYEAAPGLPEVWKAPDTRDES